MVAIQRNVWIFAILIIASMAVALFTGSAIYYRLMFFWLPILVGSWIWTKFSLSGISIDRKARGLRREVGQVFEERFILSNKSWLSRLWVQVRDESPIPDAAGSRVLTFIGRNQQRIYMAHTLLTRRGLFILGPTEMRSGDPFGLFEIKRTFANPVKLLVIPHLFDLAYFPSPQGLLPGGKALHRKSQYATPYAAGIREYQPGDPLNRIHWRSTAHKDKIMVKEFDQDPQAEVWIFLDAYQGSHIASIPAEADTKKRKEFWFLQKREKYQLPPETFEYAVSIGGSIARYFLHAGRVVGLACNSNPITILPAERGERQLGKILEALALLHTDLKLPMPGMVTSQIGYLPRGSTVIFITPAVENEVELCVDEALRRNMRPMVILIDALSFGGAAGSEALRNNFLTRNIPSMLVSNGDDLSSMGQAMPAGKPSTAATSWWKEA